MLNQILNEVIKEAHTLNTRKTIFKLRNELSLDLQRKNPEQFYKACDEASSNYNEISLMYFLASESYDKAKLEYNENYAKWSYEALKYLEKEKARGKLSGQTSEGKIKNWIINEFTDEYRTLKMQYKEKERTKKYLEHFMEAWQSRCKMLQTMKGILDKGGVFNA